MITTFSNKPKNVLRSCSVNTDVSNIYFQVLLTTQHFFSTLLQQIETLESLSVSIFQSVKQVLFFFSASHRRCKLSFLVVAINWAPPSSVRWTRQRRDKFTSTSIYRWDFSWKWKKFSTKLLVKYHNQFQPKITTFPYLFFSKIPHDLYCCAMITNLRVLVNCCNTFLIRTVFQCLHRFPRLYSLLYFQVKQFFSHKILAITVIYSRWVTQRC